MLRRVLHLLVILCLALNGWVAPSAMAMHAHAPVEVVARSAEDGATHCGKHVAAEEATDAGVPDHAAVPAEATTAQAGDCCGGDDCRCGCVLPPVMPLPALAVPGTDVEDALFRVAAIEPPLQRNAPPLRPPAR